MALPILKDAWSEALKTYDTHITPTISTLSSHLAPSPNDSTSPRKIPLEHVARAFASNVDLLSAPLGTRIISLSDEFFAEAKNLISPAPPIHRPGVYVETGAWYDGWETRRHNRQQYDYVKFGLGVSRGRPKGVEIDTGFFNGNHAPEVAVEGASIPFDPADDAARQRADETVKDPNFRQWHTILPRQPCGPACRQAWLLPQTSKTSKNAPSYTHIRLLMFPDGGIARFRLFGDVVPSLPTSPTASDPAIDLAAMTNGAVATRCSDQHFGAKGNLLLPGRGADMGDGWETKRSRGADHTDWVIVRLAASGSTAKPAGDREKEPPPGAAIERIVVDTRHFRGNFPREVRVLAAPPLPPQQRHRHRAAREGEESWEYEEPAPAPNADSLESVQKGGEERGAQAEEWEEEGEEEDDDEEPEPDSPRWVEILPAQACGPDREHVFEEGEGGLRNVKGVGFAWVMMVIIPDGGVKRLRVFGRRRIV